MVHNCSSKINSSAVFSCRRRQQRAAKQEAEAQRTALQGVKACRTAVQGLTSRRRRTTRRCLRCNWRRRGTGWRRRRGGEALACRAGRAAGAWRQRRRQHWPGCRRQRPGFRRPGGGRRRPHIWGNEGQGKGKSCCFAPSNESGVLSAALKLPSLYPIRRQRWALCTDPPSHVHIRFWTGNTCTSHNPMVSTGGCLPAGPDWLPRQAARV